jgi:hypothetical protein
MAPGQRLFANSESSRIVSCILDHVSTTDKHASSETYQLAMYLLDQYRGTALSCRYTISPKLVPASSQTQLEQTLKLAVAAVTTRHPMLQVGMTNTTSKAPSWIQLPTLNLTQQIHWVHLAAQDYFEATVQETFHAQLDDRFPDPSRPGWKITVIRQTDDDVMEILLTWNHPQFDAMGAKVFHEDLIQMLNTNSGSVALERAGFKLNGDILTLPSAPPPLPKPIESLTNIPLDVKFLLKSLWEELRPGFLNRDPSWATWCPIRPTPYRTQYRCFLLDNASVRALQTRCRDHHTTITALLNALALLAFSSRLGTTAAPAFQSSTIVDHRRNLPPGASPPNAPWGTNDRLVGNYVTQCFHRWDAKMVARIRAELPPATNDAATGASASAETGKGKELSPALERALWVAAAQNRREIAAKLDAGLRNDMLGLFKHVTDWKKTMRNFARRKRQFTWLVTNIGVLEGGDTQADPDEGEQRKSQWAITRAQFGLSAEIPLAAIEFSPVSVAGRGMVVGASWSDAAVDVRLGEGIVGDMERWMGQLAR